MKRGFTMLEIMLALLILGIGLIMVAAIFPVAANWTRENAEETVAANVAQNAVSLIKMKYSSSDFASLAAGSVSPIPGITSSGKLPIVERAYNFGVSPPYPTTLSAAQSSMYFWTACVEHRVDSNGLPTNQYSIFVFVFKKGATQQVFSASPSEISGTRDVANDGDGVPYLASGSVGNMIVGSQGVGETSGTVFRALPGGATSAQLVAGENVIYAPPADGTSVSPLVYIYQTFTSF